MKAYRAAILRFNPQREPASAAIYEEDGLLVVGPEGRPGFVDMHLHYAQTNLQLGWETDFVVLNPQVAPSVASGENGHF